MFVYLIPGSTQAIIGAKGMNKLQIKDNYTVIESA